MDDLSTLAPTPEEIGANLAQHVSPQTIEDLNRVLDELGRYLGDGDFDLIWPVFTEQTRAELAALVRGRNAA